jgi:serine/threonine-protein kinase RsbW
MDKRITLTNRIGEIQSLAGMIEELGESWALGPMLTMHINLVLEEAISNIIFYGYKDDSEHSIHIDLSVEEQILRIRIEDDGIPFDPTAKTMPDLTLSVEDRPIGGLGIYLITQLMDTVHYERTDDKNILYIEKKIEL